MMGEVNAALDGIDFLLSSWMSAKNIGKGDQHAIERVARFEGPRFLLLNKWTASRKTPCFPSSKARQNGGFR